MTVPDSIVYSVAVPITSAKGFIVRLRVSYDSTKSHKGDIKVIL